MAPEARREAILDASQALFVARGWDAVTLADVIEKAGISKGCFYHHFAAKEDLLDPLVERFVARALAETAAVRAAGRGDAVARFNAFISTMNRWKAAHGPELRFFITVMLRPGDDLLCQRIHLATTEAAIDAVRQIIADGIDEGAFTVPDAGMAAEMIMALPQGRRPALRAAMAAAQAGDLDDATRLLSARMTAEGRMIDWFLGLCPGSIALANPVALRRLLEAVTAAAVDDAP